MADNARGSLAYAARPDEQTNRSRVQIMRTGEKERNGPWYWTITADDLDVFAAYINEHGLREDHSGGRIPVDYEHTEHGRGSVAAGWFVAGTAEVDGNELWAEVQWTSTAADEIRDGRYRFLSGEFSFATKDSKTGLMTKAKEFIAATLTNRPFMTDMAPVTAATVWNADEGLENLRELVHRALNGSNSIDARYWVQDIAQGKALVESYGEGKTWVVPFSFDGTEVQLAPQSDWVEAEEEWVAAVRQSRKTTGPRPDSHTTEGDEMADAVTTDLKAVATELGLDEDASEEQILEAVRANKTKAETAPEPGEGTVVLSQDEVTTLKASAAEGAQAHKRLREMEIDTMLKDGVNDFKILPVQVEPLKTQAAASEEGFTAVKATIEATPKDALKLAGVRGGTVADEEGDEPDTPAKVRTASAQYESAKADGVDTESVKLDLQVRAALVEAGKDPDTCTESEYLAVASKVAKAAGYHEPDSEEE